MQDKLSPCCLCVQQSQRAGGAKPPRVTPKAGPPRAHRFYPTSLPRNINRPKSRQVPPGQSPPPSAAGIGWVLGSSPMDVTPHGASPKTSQAPSTSPRTGKGQSPLSGSLPLPHFQHPSHELLDRNGFQQMKYDRWKQRCLDDRAKTGVWLAPLSCLHRKVQLWWPPVAAALDVTAALSTSLGMQAPSRQVHVNQDPAQCLPRMVQATSKFFPR